MEKDATMIANVNVLVVDDEEVVRRSHLRVLTGKRCHVEAVDDGEKALKAMEAKRYDVVLLDLRMPGIDGMSVLRTMRERWPESEVIMITGYPSVETAKEAIRLGACQYLAKPLAPYEVIEAANSAIEEKHWALRHDGDAAIEANSPICGAPRQRGIASCRKETS
jgi:DNA-binding NtrC family response regulator